MSIESDGMSRRAFVGGMVTLAGMGLVACGSSSGNNAGKNSASSQNKSAKSEDVLLVGSEIAFPPYEWLTDTETEYTAPVDGGGYVDGLDVTLAKLIAKELDKDLLFVNMSFSGLIDALNMGKVDIVLSGLGDSPERAKVVNFSYSYYDSVYGLMVKKDGPYKNAQEITDFNGAAVLGQKNSPLDDMIDQIPGVNHVAPVEHVPDMFEALDKGECDAVTVPVEIANTYMNMYPDLLLVVPQNPRLDPGFTGTCAALRKDDEATLEVVNRVIQSLSKEELQQFYEEAEARQAQTG